MQWSHSYASLNVYTLFLLIRDSFSPYIIQNIGTETNTLSADLDLGNVTLLGRYDCFNTCSFEFQILWSYYRNNAGLLKDTPY